MYYKPEIKNISINGMSMDYFSFGEGDKPFVMLPGLSLGKITDSAQSVASAYRNFGKDFTVYVFERKNDIKAGYSIENMADDTAVVMKHIGISDAYVFGVSQGGMIAQCLAADYPELVKKVLLASTSAKETTLSREVFLQWICHALSGKVRELTGSFIDKLYSDEFLSKYRDFLVNMYSDTDSDELVRFCLLAAACCELDLTEKLEKIRCPVFITGSEKDKVFSVADFTLLKEKTGGEMYLYSGYGHAVYDEAPDYKDRIAEFFKD